MRHYYKFMLISILMSLISGCSILNKSHTQKPQKVNLQILTTKDINPDLQGIASPIKISIYKLKTIDSFNTLTYSDLLDKNLLEDTLIQQTHYIIHPDSIKQIPFQIDSDDKYLGVTAGYLNIEQSRWKLSLKKQPKIKFNKHNNYLYILVNKHGLQQISQTKMTNLLKEYAKRHPKNSIIKKNGKLIPPKPDYSKGIYTQTNS